MLPPHDPIADFADFGIVAFTTTRAAGSYGTATNEPVAVVMERWAALQEGVRPFSPRFATVTQVHGATVVTHVGGWEGWLRGYPADGHAALERGTALAVIVADCVPVFVAHPSGATALLHSGWRGTAAHILDAGVQALHAAGLPAKELRVHLGPAICGDCYEVSPDVYARLTGHTVSAPARVDLRALLTDQAHALGVSSVTTSPYCTRCHNDRFFSHRAGDAGRQLGVIVAA